MKRFSKALEKHRLRKSKTSQDEQVHLKECPKIGHSSHECLCHHGRHDGKVVFYGNKLAGCGKGLIIRMNEKQIIYEDKTIIVCYKPAGVAAQTAKIGQRDMVSEVTNYLAASRKDKTKPYVGLVHRLDQPVEGILVFAKDRRAAEALSRQIAENKMKKHYYAVVSDRRPAAEADAGRQGRLLDYLYKDGKTNTSSVVSREHEGAKRAELFYEVQSKTAVKKLCEIRTIKPPCPDNMTDNIADITDEEIALVKVELVNGRHHQIRVQMSHAGMSLLGDYKYADERTKKLSEQLQQKQVALCAYELGFKHPVTGKQMLFQKLPEGQIFHNFSIINCL